MAQARPRFGQCSVSTNRKLSLSVLPLTKGASCWRPWSYAGYSLASLTTTMPGDVPWPLPGGHRRRQRRLRAGGVELKLPLRFKVGGEPFRPALSSQPHRPVVCCGRDRPDDYRERRSEEVGSLLLRMQDDRVSIKRDVLDNPTLPFGHSGASHHAQPFQPVRGVPD